MTLKITADKEITVSRRKLATDQFLSVMSNSYRLEMKRCIFHGLRFVIKVIQIIVLKKKVCNCVFYILQR